MSVSIKGLSHAAVLAALYNGSKPLGMGFMQYEPKPMTEAEAENCLARSDYFDYLNGRVMKLRIRPDDNEIEERLYDRDNGQGACQRVINELRITNDTNSDVIARTAQEGTYASAAALATHLDDESTLTTAGQLTTFSMGLRDVAEHLTPKFNAVLDDKQDAETSEE